MGNATINYDLSARDVGDGPYSEEMIQLNCYLFKLRTSSNDSASFFHSYHYNDLEMAFRFCALEYDNDLWIMRNGDDDPSIPMPKRNKHIQPLLMANSKEQFDKAWEKYVNRGAEEDSYTMYAAKVEESYDAVV